MKLGMLKSNPFKLYSLVEIRGEAYAYTAQVLSLPVPATPEFPRGSLMIRRAPDMPTTLVEIDLALVHPMTRRYRNVWVHYAKVSGHGTFPVDMLRYDHAAPLNFNLVAHRFSDELNQPVHSEGVTSHEPFIVVCTTDKRATPWTLERWRSFGWRCEPMLHATHKAESVVQ